MPTRARYHLLVRAVEGFLAQDIGMEKQHAR
jgi:hypothetical protein